MLSKEKSLLFIIEREILDSSLSGELIMVHVNKIRADHVFNV